jgi:hypothetical protein
MTPAVLPALKRGDTWTLVFVVCQTPGGAPVDLTGCAAALQVRHPRTDALIATADSLAITPQTGTVTAVFLPATTAAVPVGTYLTDLEITFADGEVRSSQTLTLAVLADYTRS